MYIEASKAEQLRDSQKLHIQTKDFNKLESESKSHDYENTSTPTTFKHPQKALLKVDLW